MSSILVVTAVPDFVSAEEHASLVASTPASFDDIRPVLRHKQENVSVSLDPPLDGLSPDDCAHGVLYVIESALVFMSATGRGLQVLYPAITLHAVSRGGTPSIYCQLDDGPPLAEDADADVVAELRELTIVPQDPASLEPIFEAMSECASLHPDPDMSDEEECDGDLVTDAQFETLDGEEGEQLSEVGRAALAYLESIIQDPFHHEQKADGQVNGAEEVSSEDEGQK